MHYLEEGQYRLVQHEYDGHVRYQCLYCKQTLTTGDWIADWLFCPKCGKSWFRENKCRPHDHPRWSWDRPNLKTRYRTEKKPTRKWRIEEINPDWESDIFSTVIDVPVTMGSWRTVLQHVRTIQANGYNTRVTIQDA